MPVVSFCGFIALITLSKGMHVSSGGIHRCLVHYLKLERTPSSLGCLHTLPRRSHRDSDTAMPLLRAETAKCIGDNPSFVQTVPVFVFVTFT
eukprot:scaffold285307_cov37-Prasinocladus_malaysianus.AAC.1